MLDALRAQSFRDFEVIVVDDGSTDGSAEEAETTDLGGVPVRVIRGEHAGAVRARRSGVAATSSRYLAFTDSDCRPDPGWLGAGVAALDAGADVVNGATRPAGPVGALDHSVSSGEEGLYPTCNVFYRRSAYEAAGGFDAGAGDRLRFRLGRRARGLGFGEDTLLAWAVRRRGKATFAPDAIVEHDVVHAGVVESLSRAAMVAAFPALLREVPELRATRLVRGRVSLGHRTRVPVYLLTAALVTKHHRIAAAAAGWWVVSAGTELRQLPGSRSARLGALPIVLARDAISAASLVAGSARARTPLL
jgi:hypothetical protein